MLLYEVNRRGAREGQGAGQHFIEHDAQTINVGLRLDGQRADLFRRHVMRRADHLVYLSFMFQVGVADIFGDAKICEIGILIFIQ